MAEERILNPATGKWRVTRDGIVTEVEGDQVSALIRSIIGEKKDGDADPNISIAIPWQYTFTVLSMGERVKKLEEKVAQLEKLQISPFVAGWSPEVLAKAREESAKMFPNILK
jgi:hypothetical protein